MNAGCVRIFFKNLNKRTIGVGGVWSKTIPLCLFVDPFHFSMWAECVFHPRLIRKAADTLTLVMNIPILTTSSCYSVGFGEGL